jgi:hypothetical protein
MWSGYLLNPMRLPMATGHIIQPVLALELSHTGVAKPAAVGELNQSLPVQLHAQCPGVFD